MVDGDEVEEQEGADRLLVRPYIQQGGHRLPEGDEPAAPSTPAAPPPADPSAVDSGTAQLPAVGSAPADDRQMAWLVGAGLALVVAIGVTMVALWPGADDTPSLAAPPDGYTWPAPAGSTAPTPSAAPPSASADAGPSPSVSSSAPSAPSAPAPAASAPAAVTPPAVPPPSATLAPPPATDRVGPITGPGGDCLDVTTGIVLPGTPVAVRGCNGTLSQRWTVAADGTLRVSGACAAAGGGQVAVGPCGDAPSGQWRAGAGGTLVNTGSGQCLTGPADGNRVRVTTCGGAAQSWTLP